MRLGSCSCAVLQPPQPLLLLLLLLLPACWPLLLWHVSLFVWQRQRQQQQLASRILGVSSSPSREQPSRSCRTDSAAMSPRLPMALLQGLAVRMLL